MKTMFTFPAAKVKAALIFAASKDIRYYLNGVCFVRHGDAMLAVSTDGHRLTVIHEANPNMAEVPEGGPAKTLDPLPEGFAIIIGREQLASAVKAHTSRDVPSLILHVEEGDPVKVKADAAPITGPRKVRILANVGASVFEGREIEGKYPDWQKVIPRGVRVPSNVCVNSSYLADYHKAQRALGSSSMAGISLSTNGADSSVLVDICNVDFLSVLMPMRGDGSEGLPKWIDPPAKPAAEVPGCVCGVECPLEEAA